MKGNNLVRTIIVNMILVSIIMATFSVHNLWSQETVAVIQPGNKTLKFTNTINQPVVDIRVKDQAVPFNGDYIVRITSKSSTQATVVGNSPTNITADGFTWNELTGLEGVEMVFDQEHLLAIGDEALVTVGDGPDGKDNSISLRLPLYPNQEPYRVYKNGGLWSSKNEDRTHTRVLIQFDLSNLLSSTTVLSAEIFLFCPSQWYRSNNPPGAGMVMHRILKSWEEGTAEGINNAIINGVTGYERWYGDNQLTGNLEDWAVIGLAEGIDYEATPNSSTVLFTDIGPSGYWNAPNKFLGFNVTQLVQDWLDGTSENYGVLLKGNQIADDAVRWDILYAGYAQYWRQSEFTDNTTHRPKLKVRYIVDATPPEITVSVSPNVLWPPNHKMVDVFATVSVSDNCDPDPHWELVSVVSNEPEGGPGKKHFPDIEVVSDTQFKLRAERLGKGDGRIYTITYQATDGSGNSASAEATVIVPHDIGKGTSFDPILPAPDSYALFANYPNPFNPVTEIRFQIPEATHVLLEVYNILGEKICTLLNSQYDSGYHIVQWDGKDKNGKHVSSGMYIYCLKAGNYSSVKKMFLLR